MNSALERLQQFTAVTPDTTGLPDAGAMLSTIDEVEQNFAATLTPPVANALANAIRCYVAWYVRGDVRRTFLERAARYYRLSGNNAALGRLLVEESQVRDLKEAIALLEGLYTTSKTYEPALCFYADALYKDGQYLRAYDAAIHLHELASREWQSRPESIPTMPLQVARKALRAEARRLKKAGQPQEAMELLTRLEESGRARARKGGG
jgi:tetratricopeptide (TPR) repeat protein